MSSRKNKQKHKFTPPKKIEDLWELSKKDIYVEKPQQRMPAWLLPLIVFLIIVAIVFWAAPMTLARLQINLADKKGEDDQEQMVYSDDYRAISRSVVDIFAEADIKSERIAQALYNEPARVFINENLQGFTRVRLEDGTTGYVLSSELSQNKDSLEPAAAEYKVTITSAAKRVMSHASNGTMILEVMMGTTLYADYRGDGILRVHLTDNDYGWLSEEGTIVTETKQEIALAEDGARYFCSSAMSFHNVTVLKYGQSRNGISVEGIARLAGLANGIYLPRDMNKQMEYGRVVPHNLDIVQPADLIFFDDAANPGYAVSMAIIMEDDQCLMIRSGKTYIQLTDITQLTEKSDHIIAIRRFYPDVPLEAEEVSFSGEWAEPTEQA